MNDLFLGLIALGVLVMAVIQVALIVVALQMARRAGEAAARLEGEIRPILANLQVMSAEATRAAQAATARLEQADQAITDLGRRLDDVVQSLQRTVVRPARQGMAALQGVLSLLAAVGARRRKGAEDVQGAEEEDPLFIG